MPPVEVEAADAVAVGAVEAAATVRDPVVDFPGAGWHGYDRETFYPTVVQTGRDARGKRTDWRK